MPVLDDLTDFLVAQGVGTRGSTIIVGSKGVIPPGDGPYLVLIETGGTAPTRVQNQTSALTQRPGVQVSVRARSYAAARAMATAAYNVLDGIFNRTISGTFYQRVTARQEPTDIGLDSTGQRPVIVFNLEIERQPAAVATPAFDQAFQ